MHPDFASLDLEDVIHLECFDGRPANRFYTYAPPDAGHAFPDAERQAAYAFLDKHLQAVRK